MCMGKRGANPICEPTRLRIFTSWNAEYSTPKPKLVITRKRLILQVMNIVPYMQQVDLQNKYKTLWARILLACSATVLSLAAATFCAVPILNTAASVVGSGKTVLGPSWMMEIVSSVPLLTLALTLLVLRPTSSRAMVKAIAIGLAGAVGYVLLSIVEMGLAQKFYSWTLPRYDEATLLQAYGHDWTVMVLFLVMYTMAVVRLRRRTTAIE